ncbi:MAG: hypothetical protein ACI8PZ_005985, partial [Myxococcota bacterium]
MEAVRGEIERLDADVDQARTAAESAYAQYKTATRRVFHRYCRSPVWFAWPRSSTGSSSLESRVRHEHRTANPPTRSLPSAIADSPDRTVTRPSRRIRERHAPPG